MEKDKLIKLNDTLKGDKSRKKYNRIRKRMQDGTMKKHIEKDFFGVDWLCYSEKEYENWKPRKNGRKIKMEV